MAEIDREGIIINDGVNVAGARVQRREDAERPHQVRGDRVRGSGAGALCGELFIDLFKTISF